MIEKLCMLIFLCSGQLQAANIINNIKGVGPDNGLINPYLCIQNEAGVITPVAPGASVDGNAASGNKEYAGGALRFGGCDAEKNSYLGYVGFSLNSMHNNKVATYDPPKSPVKLTEAAIDANGRVTGKITYTAIQPNFELSTKANTSQWEFVGTNLSGLEFGKVLDATVVPNLSKQDAKSNMSDLADTESFLNAGMNTIRVPLHWGYLQLEGAGKGEINKEYYDTFVKPLLETLTSAKVNAIVDLHAYMRYSTFGKNYAGCGESGACPDGQLITDSNAYKDVWSKLYKLMKSDSKINMNYIMLDLVNEPVAVPNDLVFTIQADVIKNLRAQGFQGYILVEGNSWSGLHSWLTYEWKSTDGKITYSNASLFSRENFNKAGITDLSKILINVHQYLDGDYSGTHDQCLADLTTTGADGFNLNLFVDYLQQNHLQAIVTEFGSGKDSASCSVALKKFLDYLQDNAAKNKDYGFVGWTIWSSGHGWGGYNLRVKPSSYHMTVMKNYLN